MKVIVNPITRQTVLVQGGGLSIPGPPGPPGGTPFEFTQSSPSTLWTVAHNRGRKPNVTVLSPGGLEVIATIVHLDVNTLQVSFDEAYTGTVICL
jgi:hypothetical protein